MGAAVVGAAVEAEVVGAAVEEAVVGRSREAEEAAEWPEEVAGEARRGSGSHLPIEHSLPQAPSTRRPPATFPLSSPPSSPMRRSSSIAR